MQNARVDAKNAEKQGFFEGVGSPGWVLSKDSSLVRLKPPSHFAPDAIFLGTSYYYWSEKPWRLKQ